MARLYTPRHKRYSDQGLIIPNVEFGKGIRPWIGTEVAPYLPLQLFEEYHSEYYAILTGKAVSLDSLGFVTMAGLKKQIDIIMDDAQYATGQIDISSGTLTTLSRYDATDVAQGVVSSDGNAVVALQPVLWTFMKNGAGQSPREGIGVYDDAANNTAVQFASNTYHFHRADSVTVSSAVGVSPYSYYRSSRKNQAANAELAPVGHNTAYDVWDPTKLKFHNYNKQGRIAIVCDYVCEYPVVSSTADLLMEGVSVFHDTIANVRPGDFVTYDEASNLKLQVRKGGGAAANAADLRGGPDFEGLDFTADENGRELASRRVGEYVDDCIGQIIRYIPRHVNTAYLDRVKSRYDSSAGADFGPIDQLPGSANAGLPWNNWVTGRTDNNEDGTVLVNLIKR